jgi:fumarate hydratase class I
MAQLLINSRMSAEGHRPMCQDTGIAIAFLKVGMDVRWHADLGVEEMVNEGVRRAYTDKTNVQLVSGDKVEVIVAAKGGGSENKSRFAMLLPNDSVVDWVLGQVPTMGADWCPPGILSLGIGGSPERRC